MELLELQLRDDTLLDPHRIPSASGFETYDQQKVLERCNAAGALDARVLLLGGNAHSMASMLDRGRTEPLIARNIQTRLERSSRPWMEFLSAISRVPLVVLPPPPPIGSEEHIRRHAGVFAEKLQQYPIAAPKLRLGAWEYEVSTLRDYARRFGAQFVELPAAAFDANGFLHPAFYGQDPTHANVEYGALVLQHLADTITASRQGQRRHPYRALPETAFWKESVAQQVPAQLDPVTHVPWRIEKRDKVATAGSCFAQHISRHIRNGGYRFFVTEPEPTPGAEPMFSARYGNIYTSRQLLQLFERAFGYFKPREDHWLLPDGRYCDPFRPQIREGGFASLAELRADRQKHLAAVRKLFTNLDVFVFTLGLTECWASKLDGATYPIAPGVAGGSFDPQTHSFVNLGVDDVVADMKTFISKLRLVNPSARLILTVSPVPLAASYESEHVLVSTTYSKSVLRVAAETLERSLPDLVYFPSYEIITGSYSRGRYFAEDLRSVTEEGVSHVMRVFMDRFTRKNPVRNALSPPRTEADALDRELEELSDVVCEEALLARRD